MFSGFRSQCISLALLSRVNAFSNCCANTRTNVVLKPRNWFCLISSYRFTLSSSNTRQRCWRWMKVSLSRRMWWSSFLSSLLFSYARNQLPWIIMNQKGSMPLTLIHTKSNTETSIMLWLKYAVLFLTTFTATTSWVFRFWHLTTCPNVPWPRTSRIRYRFLQELWINKKRYRYINLGTYLWPASSDPKMSFTYKI